MSASSRARAASANSGASDVLLNVETNEPTSPVAEATDSAPKPGWLGLATLAKMRALGRHQGIWIDQVISLQGSRNIDSSKKLHYVLLTYVCLERLISKEIFFLSVLKNLLL